MSLSNFEHPTSPSLRRSAKPRDGSGPMEVTYLARPSEVMSGTSKSSRSGDRPLATHARLERAGPPSRNGTPAGGAQPKVESLACGSAGEESPAGKTEHY
uniref:Uncharacterized protein n=1 Tax=Trichuris muris TaxID=70415 RepID=A0A5S6QBY8_TRIMR